MAIIQLWRCRCQVPSAGHSSIISLIIFSMECSTLFTVIRCFYFNDSSICLFRLLNRYIITFHSETFCSILGILIIIRTNQAVIWLWLIEFTIPKPLVRQWGITGTTSPSSFVVLFIVYGTKLKLYLMLNSCIYSGDARVKDSETLTVLHTLLHRQHNRLAQKLGRVNPLWDDETLFQEARRIVSAQVQHISYGEFSSAILGESLADNLRLTPHTMGHFEGYDIDAYPGTFHAAVDVALASWISMMPPLRLLRPSNVTWSQHCFTPIPFLMNHCRCRLALRSCQGPSWWSSSWAVWSTPEVCAWICKSIRMSEVSTTTAPLAFE